jgi:hypothetical protein
MNEGEWWGEWQGKQAPKKTKDTFLPDDGRIKHF